MESDQNVSDVVKHSDIGAGNGSGKTMVQPSRHRGLQRTIIIMSASLLLAVVAAVAHHLWNNHWNGQVVETAAVSQTWVKNFGTAFAFLVKMFLAVVTSTAFVQQFWITLKAKPVALGQVDSMFTVLQSALQFLSITIWLHNPLLAGLAIITWLLPLVAIVTPGTLNVIPISTTYVDQYRVPQFDFIGRSESFANGGNNGGRALGASSSLQRLSISTASTLDIGQIQIPFADASYDLEFFGPALSCSPAPASITTQVSKWLGSIEGVQISWLSFAPGLLDYIQPGQNPLNTSDSAQNLLFPFTYHYNIPGNASISVFVAMNNDSSLISSTPMVECTLYNASYQVNFQFAYPKQTISVIQRTLHSPILASSPDTALGTPNWAYLNLMDAFDDILVGYTEVSGGGSSSYQTKFQVTALGYLGHKGFGNEEVMAILENMFQNITLGLLSDSSFTLDNATAQPVAVTVARVENVYDYQSEDLYLAYGLGILVAIGCFVIGLISIRRNSGSYTNDFSTVLRTTRHISLGEAVDAAQSSGLSPLGKDLAEIKIVMMERDIDSNVPTGFQVARLTKPKAESESESQVETELLVVETKQSKDQLHLNHPLTV